MTSLAYQKALDYIYSFVDFERNHRMQFGYDLRRVYELLSLLVDPHLKAHTVHIAGSKGKGSTAATVASILIAAGYKTGLYTSPHLIDFRERIQINGSPITEEEFGNLVQEIRPVVEGVNKQATYGRLTTFEVTTSLAFLYFARKDVDFQVIEVGLGGRLDATNVVRPEVSIITNISLEHTDVLGYTLPEIAREKAGIIKAGVPVVSAPQRPEVEAVLEESASKVGAELIEIGRDVSYEVLSHSLDWQTILVKGMVDDYELDFPLGGIWQAENVACAIAAAEILKKKGFSISRDSILSGASNTNWPGRFQIINRRPLVIVDGAHSPYSAHLLRLSLESYFPRKGKAFLVIGCSSDKDIGGIARELGPYFDYVLVTRSRHPRAMPEDLIAREFPTAVVEKMPAVADALGRSLLLAQEDGIICVTGSLYVVGEALEATKTIGRSQTG